LPCFFLSSSSLDPLHVIPPNSPPKDEFLDSVSSLPSDWPHKIRLKGDEPDLFPVIYPIEDTMRPGLSPNTFPSSPDYPDLSFNKYLVTFLNKSFKDVF
jgi:hypothetical protein